MNLSLPFKAQVLHDVGHCLFLFIPKTVKYKYEGFPLNAPCLAVRCIDNQTRPDHDHLEPVAQLTDRHDDHVFREEVNVLCPALHPHVPLLCFTQILIVLKTVWLYIFARWLGEHGLVEHCGANMHVAGVLLVQLLLAEVT